MKARCSPCSRRRLTHPHRRDRRSRCRRGAGRHRGGCATPWVWGPGGESAESGESGESGESAEGVGRRSCGRSGSFGSSDVVKSWRRIRRWRDGLRPRCRRGPRFVVRRPGATGAGRPYPPPVPSGPRAAATSAPDRSADFICDFMERPSKGPVGPQPGSPELRRRAARPIRRRSRRRRRRAAASGRIGYTPSASQAMRSRSTPRPKPMPGVGGPPSISTNPL